MIASNSRRAATPFKPQPIRKQPAGQRVTRLGLFALEPRIVFDAAAAVTADVAADQVAQQQADASTSDAPDAAADGSSSDGTAPSDIDASQTDYSAPATDSPEATNLLFDNTMPATEMREIAFVDGAIENVSELISGFSSTVEIVIIDSARDGIEQIANALHGQTDIAAIHIVSHGSEGVLSLGTASLDVATMQGEYLDDLTAIGKALSAEGDILIYGCDFTAGEKGLEAAMVLGGITGADIAASIDATGSADRLGDWDLETHVGSIEGTSVAASTDWSGLLAAPVANNDGPISMIGGVTQNINVLANDTDADTVSALNLG